MSALNHRSLDGTVHLVGNFHNPVCQYQRKVMDREYTDDQGRTSGPTDDPPTCQACVNLRAEHAIRQERQLADYREKLADGTTIRYVERALAPFPGRNDSKANAIDYRKAVDAVAAMLRRGGHSPQVVEVANVALRSFNPHGTRYDFGRQAAGAIASLFQTPFDDVAARTGPEPIRHSTAQKPWTFHTRLLAQLMLSELTDITQSSVPGPGWALASLIEEERIRL